MTHRHYDVIVLGRSLGALTTAALLARRDFTVLVLGQGQRPPSYRLGSRTFRRRAFTMLAASSPVWQRVISELAQSQTWKRRVVSLSPMMQVLAPRRRIDFPPDLGLLTREIERELPDLVRVVNELYAELGRVNGAADDAFSQDAVWPPGGFWERRETGRYAAMLPYIHAEPDADLLLEFPRGHFFRQIVAASVLFATNLSFMPPPFAVARLHGAWTRGVSMLPRGEEELEELLLERITAHGGRCLLDERATSVHLRRGVAAGVVLGGDDRPTGASFVVTDGDGEGLATLAGGQGIHKRALREWPRITSSIGRFVVSILVRREGLPDPLGAEAFLLPASPEARRAGGRGASRPPPAYAGELPAGDAARPVVHLQRAELSTGDEVLLVAEILLADRGGLALQDAREVVLDAVASELPFLEQHLVAVDSPHDGHPAWLYEGGRRHLVERALLKDTSTKPEPMVRKLEVDPPGYLGLAGEPVRGPIERTLLVGPSVLPGLGQEGQLLAAWSAARLVTRTDRKKERMRRDMWSKVDIG